MKSPSLIEVVQTMYAAFGRGEIPAVLARLSPDVDWRISVDPKAPGVAQIPTLGVFRGQKGVGEFFSTLARDLEFHTFQPTTFLAGANEVVSRVTIEVTVRSTKRRVRVESFHVFTFDGNGHVTQFREYSDTLAIAAAWGVIKAAS